jgi:hypothetical protein
VSFQARVRNRVLLVALSAAYFSTLFSFTNKRTLYLQNALPALFIVLAAATALPGGRGEQESPGSAPVRA